VSLDRVEGAGSQGTPAWSPRIQPLPAAVAGAPLANEARGLHRRYDGASARRSVSEGFSCHPGELVAVVVPGEESAKIPTLARARAAWWSAARRCSSMVVGVHRPGAP